MKFPPFSGRPVMAPRAVLLVITSLVLVVSGCTSKAPPAVKPYDRAKATRAYCETLQLQLVKTFRGLLDERGRPVRSVDAVQALQRQRDRLAVAEVSSVPAASRPLKDLQESLARLTSAFRARDVEQILTLTTTATTSIAAYHDVCTRKYGKAASAADATLKSKIKHVVFIMQENRSFDHYFASYPGADGVVSKKLSVCIPNPAAGRCSKPHHDGTSVNHGGPHTADASIADINGGKMDGFVAEWDKTRRYCLKPGNSTKPTCAAEGSVPDVMGYKDDRDIPNYWAYAKNFVLQDRMFAPNIGWSQPAHLAMVSGWSAVCHVPLQVSTCRPSVTFNDVDASWPDAPSYGWTDLTWLLHKYGVSWGYYVAPGSVNDCEGTTDEQIHCTPGVPGFDPIGTPEPWNPLPDFVTVQQNDQVKNVQHHKSFFSAAESGTLPSVSWVLPGWYDSEHPPTSVRDGQAWVTRVVNAVMSGPSWKDTAIFVSWDDWGGFYDHVVPPKVDDAGYGLRVPGLMISAYARKGMVDHQTLSFDAYLKFTEDVFLGGTRLDPYSDGRWDPRPSVREEADGLGDLAAEFDFTQPPRPPMVLRVRPK